MKRAWCTSRTAGLVLIIGLLHSFQLGILVPPTMALTAEEKLADPILEDRARALSKQLRCLVCQNQSIDDSDAELAKDLRREVRKLLQTGASDQQILTAIQMTYGDYVLLKPPVSSQTWLLWLAPVMVLLCGSLIVGLNLLCRSGARKPAQQAIPRVLKTAEQNLPRTNLPTLYVLGTALIMLISAGLLYTLYGRPDLSDKPLHERTAELAEKQAETKSRNEELAADFLAAQEAVATQPEDLQSWLRLAFAAAGRGDYETEINALETALRLSVQAPEIKSMLAEAMSRAADGQVTIPARQLIEDVLEQTPDEPRALFLHGLAAYQDKDFQTAIDRWMHLYNLSASDAPWLSILEKNLKQAAEDGNLQLPKLNAVAKSQADVAQMSQDEQQEMIEQMVANLAARLKDEPGDRDGWIRLAQSYGVLGRVLEQIEALFRAAELDPSDARLVIHLSEVILQSGQSDIYAARIGDLFDSSETDVQSNPQWLFFKGHFAEKRGHGKLARESWSQLLSKLPADSELALLLEQKNAALPE